MVNSCKSYWKTSYFSKIIRLLDECLIVCADNVGSKQLQMIRIALRSTAVILMGKNTMIRKAIRGHLEQNPYLEKLQPYIKGNVGLVFTNGNLNDIPKIFQETKVAAPAKAGAIAPLDVTLRTQITSLGPVKISFFQSLAIPTRISKGAIEILYDVKIFREGDKIGASEAILLNMLNISPFAYGLVIDAIYDGGAIYGEWFLDIKHEDIILRFLPGVVKIVSLSLSIGYPTMASIPHSIVNGFNNLLAIAAVTDVTFKEAEPMKEFLLDPSKFAVSAPVAATAETPAAAEKTIEKNEDEDDDDGDMGFGLFDQVRFRVSLIFKYNYIQLTAAI